MPKFLLIRLSSIGDIVLTTPVIRCLKLQMPDATIHFLVKKKFATVLQHNPYIDKLLLFEGRLYQNIQVLRNESYDYIIDLHNNQRTLLLKWALRIPSFSFNKLNISKWLLVHFKYNNLPKLHIVDRYLATLQHFNIKNDGKGLDFPIPVNQHINIKQYFPNLLTPKYLALVIGAAHATKQMPTHKIVKLCASIKHPIILLGGKNDQAKSYEIMHHLNNPQHVYNSCGKLSLHQSASILQQAHLVLSPDTGLMHIAAALAKNIIVVWGNTVPDFGMYPYLAQHTSATFINIQASKLACRPCSKIGHRKCPKQHFNCMEQLETTQITIAIAQYWS